MYHSFSYGGRAVVSAGHRRLLEKHQVHGRHEALLGSSTSTSSSSPSSSHGSSSSNNTHLRVHVTLFHGDFYLLARHERPPLKLIPPYVHMGAQLAVEKDLYLCDLENGTHYVGFLGGHTCGAYDIVAETFTGDCADSTHLVSSTSATTSIKELRIEHFEFGLRALTSSSHRCLCGFVYVCLLCVCLVCLCECVMLACVCA